MDREIQAYIDKIRAVIPFEISSVKVHDGGDDFLVFELNFEWMFRFPRNDISQKALEKEMQFLAKFKSLSPLPIPNYQYVEDGFAGYAKVCGRHLSDELFQGFSSDIRKKVTEQLGLFLSALHNFSLEEANEIGLTQGWDGNHH